MKKQIKLAGALLAIMMYGTSGLYAQALSETKNAMNTTQFCGVSWANLGNLSANDGMNASCTLNTFSNCTSPGCFLSRMIQSSGFNFSIPGNATITGIQARMKRKASMANSIKDINFFVIDDWIEDTIVSKPKTTYWPTTAAYASYGGTTNLWNTIWTPNKINNPNFGILFQCQNKGSGPVTAYIDHLQLIVYYSIGPDNRIQVRDYNDNNAISVYPDPASSMLNISFKNELSVYQIKIMNETGQMVLNKEVNISEGLHDEQVDVAGLPRGIYILRLISQDHVISEKFIKE